MEKDWLGSAKTAPASGAPDCPVVHRTVSGAPGANWPLSGIDGATWLKITRLSGAAPDCLVSLQRPRPSTSATNSSLSGKPKSTAAKIHRTVWWCTGLPGESEPSEPTVTNAISGQRVARANGRLGTPDSVRCANETADPTIEWARKGRGSSTGLLQ
jgi:hypothetical protein